MSNGELYITSSEYKESLPSVDIDKLYQLCHIPFIDIRLGAKNLTGPALIDITQKKDNILEHAKEVLSILDNLPSPEDKCTFLTKMMDPSLTQSQKMLVLETMHRQMEEEREI